MLLRYERLQWFPTVFKSMTGLRVPQFDALVTAVLPRFHAAEFARLDRPDRTRAVGGGPTFELDARNQILLTVVWLRVYPIHEVLAYLFGISDSTVSRIIARAAAAGSERAGYDAPARPRAQAAPHLGRLVGRHAGTGGGH